jgi:hypothetical protein
MSRPGHTFHFPRGSRVLAETGPKTSMISMGIFCPDTAVSACVQPQTVPRWRQ